jgi:glycosyltransferase involved in cell wall biosynthesis
VPDIVAHGSTGMLAAPGDEAGIAALARELLSDASKRSRFGNAAAAAVASEHSLIAAAASLRRHFAAIPALAESN